MTQHSATTVRPLAIGLAIVLVLATGLRMWANASASRELDERAAGNLQRSVVTARATVQPAERKVSLPGTLRGYQESVLYARTNGYVAAWHKTIGDEVRAGEVLATLSAPEQERELLQARAMRQQVGARAGLAHASLARWETQRQYNVISQQAFEEKRSENEQAQAELAAVDANVQRLEQQLAFLQVVAPFEGVITRRSVDVGALVTSGATELFALAQTSKLRLTLWVPQIYANEVHTAQRVSIRVNEISNRLFAGVIEHVSGAIDPTTHARQVDIMVPNEGNMLLPGSYASVGIDVVSNYQNVLVPPNGLLVGKEGPRVVLVKNDGRVTYQPVQLGRDLGKQVEVVSGLSVDDTLVLNPSELLQEGEVVKVARSATAE